MKQLNNPNGQSIVIDKIDYNSGRVVFTTYEYDNTNPLIKSVKNINGLIDYTNQTVKSFDGIYELLSDSIDSFVVSEDIQNWTVITGSTGNPTTLRVYIPSKLLNEVTNTGNHLDLLIKSMAPLGSFTQKLENGTLQYLEILEDEPRAILEDVNYKGLIKIEYKELT